MVFQTSETYNSGGWVKVEAARAERNGVETGVLRVSFNGAKEELMDTIDLPRGAEFQASTSATMLWHTAPFIQMILH